MPNLDDPHYDEPRARDGFRSLRARLGRQLGTERLGISQWEIPPGEAAYPYHYHLGEEELLIVLEGRPVLRAPSGTRELAEGELVALLPGEAGAHQLINRTESAVRFLAISTNGEPDIVVYPDSDKALVRDSKPDRDAFRAMFRLADAVDYWLDEQPPTQ